MIIILGPPAAGKSTITNEIAWARKAAILDSDEIKKALPEFEGGVGATAVHEESSETAQALQDQLIQRGTNIVLPKVGEDLASIERVIALFRKQGYQVEIVNMAVSPEIARRRMFARFVATGRLILPEYIDHVGVRPTVTYRALKEKGAADGYAEIDNNGRFGQTRPITDRAGSDPFRGSSFNADPGGKQRPGSDPGAARLDGPATGGTKTRLNAAELSTGQRIAAARADLGDDLDAIEFDLSDGTTVSGREMQDLLDQDAARVAVLHLGKHAKNIGVSMFEAGQIDGFDAQKVFHCAGNVVTFTDPWRARDGPFKGLMSGFAVAFQADGDMGQKADAQFGGI